ncbi:hypothetical protein GEV33_008991 [Tenebrio molitor]|jgi:hypothetical protein|uniref:Uncharacterized protein n=1 Tax=Tenebrio molitor TaxID=7067 RepID=A0A8J6H850_TENMO|nr:hypothetical protein GEV33_008991 [Tenebrio molitor]
MAPHTDLFTAFNFIRKFLEISGHWPHTTLSISSELRSFLSFTSSLIFFVTNMMEIVLHFSDFKDLAENMSVTAPVFAYIVKLVVFKMKRREFFRMVEMMTNAKTFEPRSEAHGDFVKTMGKTCILVMKIYGGICAVVVTLYACLSLSSETVLPIKFSYDFGSWVYGMYAFQMTAIMNVALNTVCLDMLAVCFMGTAIAQLQILEQKIHDLTKFDHEDYSPEEETRRMKQCVVHHTDIIK